LHHLGFEELVYYSISKSFSNMSEHEEESSSPTSLEIAIDYANHVWEETLCKQKILLSKAVWRAIRSNPKIKFENLNDGQQTECREWVARHESENLEWTKEQLVSEYNSR
jgi:hypothetical protein